MPDPLLRCWLSLKRAGFDAERHSDRVIVSVRGLEARLIPLLAEQPFFRQFDDRFVIQVGPDGPRLVFDYWRPAQLLLHGLSTALILPALLANEGEKDLPLLTCWFTLSQLAIWGATLLPARRAASRIRAALSGAMEQA